MVATLACHPSLRKHPFVLALRGSGDVLAGYLFPYVIAFGGMLHSRLLAAVTVVVDKAPN